jgi:hypothetical protein
MDLKEIGWGRTDWIELCQDKAQWRAVVIRAMNILVS